MERIEELQVLAYQISKYASIEWRGEGTWAVIYMGMALNDAGNWEYEPSPSNRSDAFIARTRYNSAQEALDKWNATGGDEHRKIYVE